MEEALQLNDNRMKVKRITECLKTETKSYLNPF